jgi:Tol biopolymer transport system component
VVSQLAGFLASPIFSPDGKMIAFAAGAGFLAQDLYIVPVTGGEPKRLTAEGRYVNGMSWTADGKQIAFSSDRGGLRSLWSISVLGGKPEPLSAVGEDAYTPTVRVRLIASSRQNFGADVSNDGKKIE